MDFSNAIIEFLGIQDVIIEDIKRFKKDLRVEIKIRQKRAECFCHKCGLHLDWLKNGCLKSLKPHHLVFTKKSF